MTRPPLRLPAFLRASLLGLLVLGLVAKPVLAHIGELHAAEHALLADADGHGHDHEHDDGHDDESGTDHTQGTHGLMHQASTGGAFSEMTAVIALSAIHGSGGILPSADVSHVPAQHFATPFRPPIV